MPVQVQLLRGDGVGGTLPWDLVTDGDNAVNGKSDPVVDFGTHTRLASILTALGGTLLVGGSVAVTNQPTSIQVSNFPATQPVSGTVAISNFPATQPVSGTVAISGTVPVSAAALAQEATLAKRNGGAKSAATAVINSIGDTTLRTPASGKAITLFWIQAIPDPQASANPVITIKLGAVTVYQGYALSHWEPFTGAANDTLVVNLSSGGTNVAVTAHYTEA